jgi:LacI family gluconate utilization system Gnt-I transcriptional repressor
VLADYPGCSVDTIGIPKTSPLSFDDGAAVIRSLQNGTQSACDALVFVNDVPAAGAVFECLRAGIRIPQDLAIIGFGDSDLAAQISPGLTTVHVEADRMGRIAGELLLADIGQAQWKNRSQEVGFKLVVRETT